MFKKLALYTIILFSYVNPSIAVNEDTEVIISAAQDYIDFAMVRTHTYCDNHYNTMQEMLNFLTNETGQNPSLILSNYLELNNNNNFFEAFVDLVLYANTCAQNHMRTQENTDPLMDFIKKNNDLILNMLDLLDIYSNNSNQDGFIEMKNKIIKKIFPTPRKIINRNLLMDFLVGEIKDLN